MKDGIPSGKTEEDVLAEVRREAFSLRGKSANDDPTDDVDDPLNSSKTSLTTNSSQSNAWPTSSSSSSSTSSAIKNSTSSTIKPKDDWEKWYPMEWVAWITYGPPSGEASDLWVTEAISDGPKFIELKKKPVGRVDQRKQEIDLKATTKVQSDSNTLKSTQIILQQSECAISMRQDDLLQIRLQLEYATTDEEKVLYVRVFVRVFSIFLQLFSEHEVFIFSFVIDVATITLFCNKAKLWQKKSDLNVLYIFRRKLGS